VRKVLHNILIEFVVPITFALAWCVLYDMCICVLCLIVVPLPPGIKLFAVQINNNNNNILLLLLFSAEV
jgi:hypothetical protein